jgi:hypothetical protein
MSDPRARDAGPWFRARPRAAYVVSVLMFGAVLAVRLADQRATDAVSMLYTLPVALVALAFGRWAGLVAGVAAVLLVVLWVVVSGEDLSLLGWLSRALPLVLLGALLGDASDRLSRAERHRLALEATAQRMRDATEVNDTLVQGMAAAKWALESGRRESGLKTLDDTLRLGHQLVSELLREGDMGVNGHRPPARV